jgi:hypothetical protein
MKKRKQRDKGSIKTTKKKRIKSFKPIHQNKTRNRVSLSHQNSDLTKIKEESIEKQTQNHKNINIFEVPKRHLNTLTQSKVNKIKGEKEFNNRKRLCDDLFNVFPVPRENKSIQMSAVHVNPSNVPSSFDFKKLSEEIATNLGKVLSTSLGIVSQNMQNPIKHSQPANSSKNEVKSEQVSVHEIMKETIYHSGLTKNNSTYDKNELLNKVDIPKNCEEEVKIEKNEILEPKDSISIQEIPNFQTFQNFYKQKPEENELKITQEAPIQKIDKSFVKADEIPLLFEELKNAYNDQEKMQSRRLNNNSIKDSKR